MATRSGLVKKTELVKYSRPMRGGIIAIRLREDDELVDVAITKTGDEIVLSTSNGMAIRFSEADARPMGRDTSGVRGIALSEGDSVVGMVVAEPECTMLTVCANGYGKRTSFGPNTAIEGEDSAEGETAEAGDAEEVTSSANRYRTQRRGGKGLRDIKTTDRNGPVIAIAAVSDDDEVLMMTARGKLQRIRAHDVSRIGRNTQGVRIMSLDEGDQLAAVVRVPREEKSDLGPEPAGSDEPAPGGNEAAPGSDAENGGAAE
jgi:DNA gyrase subunit A